MRLKMIQHLLTICLFLPSIDSFVSVLIHRNSIYQPHSPCALIRNASLTGDVSIQTCIWECVYERDCQTAVYFDNDKICTLFKEFYSTGQIQSSGNVRATVIVYQKNHNPDSTCSSSAAPDTTVLDKMTSIETSTVSTSAEKIPITTTTTTTTTSRVPVYQVITNSSDLIVAIYNATAGGSSLNSTNGIGENQYRDGQGPTVCIDFLNSTCLNFGRSSLNGSALSEVGVGTGIYTVPLVGASVLRSFQFQTGGDWPNRDPLTITLEGSNATGIVLSHGSSWSSIYSGPTGLSPYPFNESRYTWGPMQNFSNNASFTAYRMLVTSQRGPDICTQFSEIRLFQLV